MAREGESTRGGLPLSLGGLPREIFFSAFCAFIMGFYAFGTRFQSRVFAKKYISWRMRKPNDKQNRFQIVTFFLLFSSAYFLDVMSPMFPQVLANYF